MSLSGDLYYRGIPLQYGAMHLARYTGLSRGEDREGAGSRNGPKRVLARSPFRARHSPCSPAFPGQQFGALAAQLLHNDAEKPAPGAGNFPAACTDKKIF